MRLIKKVPERRDCSKGEEVQERKAYSFPKKAGNVFIKEWKRLGTKKARPSLRGSREKEESSGEGAERKVACFTVKEMQIWGYILIKMKEAQLQLFPLFIYSILFYGENQRSEAQPQPAYRESCMFTWFRIEAQRQFPSPLPTSNGRAR